MHPQPIASVIPEALNSTEITRKLSQNSSTDWIPKLDAYHPDLVIACEQARRFVAAMAAGANPYWLTFSGIPGTGKTMLARQIFEQAKLINPGNPLNNPIWPPYQVTGILSDKDRRPYCVWLDSVRFASRMREGEYDLPESFNNDFFLAFDDLGTDRDKSSFIAEAVYRLASSLLRNWMIWTTNLTASEISARIDDRIASRMIRDDNKFISLRCGDYALHN